MAEPKVSPAKTREPSIPTSVLLKLFSSFSCIVVAGISPWSMFKTRLAKKMNEKSRYNIKILLTRIILLL
jgi:hypothetical protein